MTPLLKWVGGKARLVDVLLSAFSPASYERLIEPFAGAASLFFSTPWPAAFLVDVCMPLVEFYLVLQQRPKLLMRFLNVVLGDGLSSAAYYRARKRFNRIRLVSTLGAFAERAALFVFLNRLCFHGLWRVNAAGNMNVAYGHYKKPWLPAWSDIRLASRALRNARIGSLDFSVALNEAGEGDLVYCDPPYLGTFSGYNAEPFSYSDHVRLSKLTLKARARGATIVVSNSAAKKLSKLYPPESWEVLDVPNVQSIAPQNGGKKPEVLLVAR